MRPIDSKYHIEGEQIVKTATGEAIPEDEPTFLFRARDPLAVPTLIDYLGHCISGRCKDLQIARLHDTITEFEQFRKQHPERMKQPGSTLGKTT